MADHPWIAAADLLRRHYAAMPPRRPRYAWATLVDVVAGARRSRPPHRHEALDDESLLADPTAIVSAGVAEVGEALERIGRPARSAGVLTALARWWIADS